MTVRVRIPTPLRAATDGVAEVALDSPDVAAAIGELEQRYPAIKGRIRGDDGALRRFVNLYVNGEDVRFLSGLQTELNAGDELSIIPAVAGGLAPFDGDRRAAADREQCGRARVTGGDLEQAGAADQGQQRARGHRLVGRGRCHLAAGQMHQVALRQQLAPGCWSRACHTRRRGARCRQPHGRSRLAPGNWNGRRSASGWPSSASGTPLARWPATGPKMSRPWKVVDGWGRQ